MVVRWGCRSITPALYHPHIPSTQWESHRNLLGAFIAPFSFPQRICSASGVKAVKPDFSIGWTTAATSGFSRHRGFPGALKPQKLERESQKSVEMPQQFPHVPHAASGRLYPDSLCSASGWQEARPDHGAAKHQSVPYLSSHASDHLQDAQDCSEHLSVLCACPIPLQSQPFLVFHTALVPPSPHIAPDLTTQKIPPCCLTFRHTSGQQPWFGATLGSSNSWLLLTLVLMPGSNLDFRVRRPWGNVELRERQELRLDMLPSVQGISARVYEASDHNSVISHCNLCALVSHLWLISHNLVSKQDLSFSMP